MTPMTGGTPQPEQPDMMEQPERPAQPERPKPSERPTLPELPEHLLVGLSGGADSVALLTLLRERGGLIEAVHVNHGLRGEDSDGDEAFVRALCRDWGVPLRVYRATPPEARKDGGLPGEDWARQARYGFFREAMRETGADALALAHHLDDQAETLLMRLMRGAGLTGLTGMAADSTQDGMRVVRPLLHVSGGDLRAMLRERGQPWREDGSNRDDRYLRNALRLDVMPRLEARAPGAARRMAETANLLREDEDALRSLTEAYLDREPPTTCLALEPLRQQPVGLKRRILRLWWERQGMAPLERGHTDDLLALLDAPAGTRRNLPGDWHAHRGWTHLHLVPPHEEEPPRPIPAADGAVMSGVTLTLGEPDGTKGDGRATQLLPADLLDGCTLRLWQPGDWIRPFGMQGSKPLQDYFTDRHVDAPFRRRIPLVCRGSEALLVCGVGAGHVPRMTDETGMLLRWTGPMPWKIMIRKDGKHA